MRGIAHACCVCVTDVMCVCQTCRKLEEDVGLLQMQLQQRESELAQLQQQVGGLNC